MRRTLSLVLLIAAPSAFGQALSADRAEIMKNVATELSTRAYVTGVDLTRWEAIVAASQSKLAAAKTDDNFAREVNVDLRQFGASHFRFMIPRQDETRRTQRIVGLGIAGAPGKEGFRVTNVAPESPAAKAGIRVGDLIVSLDGGFSLQYPTTDYVTVANRRLEANPIIPVVDDANADEKVVKATYVLRCAQLRKQRFGA